MLSRPRSSTPTASISAPASYPDLPLWWVVWPGSVSYRELPDVGTGTNPVLCAPNHRAISLGPSEPHFKQFNLIWKCFFLMYFQSSRVLLHTGVICSSHSLTPEAEVLTILQSHDFHAIKPTRAAHPGETSNTHQGLSAAVSAQRRQRKLLQGLSFFYAQYFLHILSSRFICNREQDKPATA